MRKKELAQIYQILNKTFRDIALTFAGLALENNFKDEVITDFLTVSGALSKNLKQMKGIIIVEKIHSKVYF